MNNKNYIQAVLIFCLIIFSAGCTNLNKLSDYSSNAAKSLKQFEELGYTFRQACTDKCEIEQLRNKQLLAQSCDCKADKEADKVNLLLYTAIKGYFDGLIKLSDKKLTVYKFNALQKAFKEGDFGGVKISNGQVGAYSKISNILTNAITDTYRKRKLAYYIGEANEAIKILLQALEFNLLQNLSKKLDVKRQRFENFYFDLAGDSTISAYENKQIIEEFNTSLSRIEVQQERIATFARGLNNIIAGHQKLYDNRNKLNTTEIKELLSTSASDIQDIVDEFNTLKNQH